MLCNTSGFVDPQTFANWLLSVFKTWQWNQINLNLFWLNLSWCYQLIKCRQVFQDCKIVRNQNLDVIIVASVVPLDVKIDECELDNISSGDLQGECNFLVAIFLHPHPHYHLIKIYVIIKKPPRGRWHAYCCRSWLDSWAIAQYSPHLELKVFCTNLVTTQVWDFGWVTHPNPNPNLLRV